MVTLIVSKSSFIQFDFSLYSRILLDNWSDSSFAIANFSFYSPGAVGPARHRPSPGLPALRDDRPREAGRSDRPRLCRALGGDGLAGHGLHRQAGRRLSRRL